MFVWLKMHKNVAASLKSALLLLVHENVEMYLRCLFRTRTKSVSSLNAEIHAGSVLQCHLNYQTE